MNRRTFLTAVGVGVGVVGIGGVASCQEMLRPGQSTSGGTGNLLESLIPIPIQFGVELPRVPVLNPVRTDEHTDYYELTQREVDLEIVGGLKTSVWAYDGLFPGPTIEARSHREISVRIRNELPVPTSTHLHGGVTPPESDGYPTDLILPAGYDKRVDASMQQMRASPGAGHQSTPSAEPDAAVWTLHNQEKEYRYPLPQRAATLWYHDHRMDFSAPQVWRGLVGSMLVRDGEEASLNLPAGDKELSLLICDRSFGADGSLLYPSIDPRLSEQGGVHPAYMDGVLGDVILVNGAPWPIAHVANTRYRLRIVNASNARRYDLVLKSDKFGEVPLTQIGSDGGLLPVAQRLSSVPISPGERFDVVVDFSAFPVGSNLILNNRTGTGSAASVMKFVVDREEKDLSDVPSTLSSTYELLAKSRAVAARTFDFRLSSKGMWTINGQHFDPKESFSSPKLGTIERWSFTSDFNHPVHVHLAHFQVLTRNGREPDPADAGWKDTINVTPFGLVEVLVRFTGYRGRYMLHCHNLEHEDMAMMSNFTVA